MKSGTQGKIEHITVTQEGEKGLCITLYTFSSSRFLGKLRNAFTVQGHIRRNFREWAHAMWPEELGRYRRFLHGKSIQWGEDEGFSFEMPPESGRYSWDKPLYYPNAELPASAVEQVGEPCFAIRIYPHFLAGAEHSLPVKNIAYTILPKLLVYMAESFGNTPSLQSMLFAVENAHQMPMLYHGLFKAIEEHQQWRGNLYTSRDLLRSLSANLLSELVIAGTVYSAIHNPPAVYDRDTFAQAFGLVLPTGVEHVLAALVEADYAESLRGRIMGSYGQHRHVISGISGLAVQPHTLRMAERAYKGEVDRKNLLIFNLDGISTIEKLSYLVELSEHIAQTNRLRTMAGALVHVSPAQQKAISQASTLLWYAGPYAELPNDRRYAQTHYLKLHITPDSAYVDTTSLESVARAMEQLTTKYGYQVLEGRPDHESPAHKMKRGTRFTVSDVLHPGAETSNRNSTHPLEFLAAMVKALLERKLLSLNILAPSIAHMTNAREELRQSCIEYAADTYLAAHVYSDRDAARKAVSHRPELAFLVYALTVGALLEEGKAPQVTPLDFKQVFGDHHRTRAPYLDALACRLEELEGLAAAPLHQRKRTAQGREL